MKLYEFEGKQLLKQFGIAVPRSVLVGDAHALPDLLVVKAQVLSGKRGKAGAIKICSSVTDAQRAVKELLGKKVNNEVVQKVLLEERLDVKNEFYVSVVYDTRARAPVVVLSKFGGMDVEEIKKNNPKSILIHPIDATDEFTAKNGRALATKAGLPEIVGDVIAKLVGCFQEFDCRTAEINPLVETLSGAIVAADAKIVLDDDGLFRHQFNFPPRAATGRELTELEKEARQIDKEDYRGTAGSSFVELDGDIAVLASGGGASITAVDALIGYGGKPANYVEYSGNPPKSKVKRLAEVTLSKSGLNGCWIVGGRANFTDIYETFKGIAEALIEIKPKYPIVIRRAGPRDKEAFEMMRALAKEHGWNSQAFGNEMPMTESAKVIVDLAAKYAHMVKKR